MGKLYGLGVGPGDPELITIKSKRILNEVNIIFCPIKKEGAESFAYEIVKDHIENSNVQISNLIFPMNYNQDELYEMWKKNGEIITNYLKGDKIAAFITLGDTTIYSTFMNVVPFIDDTFVDVEIIPGITSFCTVASEEKVPLVIGDESLAIVPISKKNNTDLSKVIKDNDNIVLMKPFNQPEAIFKILKEEGLEEKFMLISNVGTKHKKMVKDINELENMKIPYLSTIIIKKGGIK